MISKLGIPSTAAPFCSYQLKRKAIIWYVKNVIKWTDYFVAIGIRADEIDRMNPNFRKEKILYFLIKDPHNKKMINDFWRAQSFNLTVDRDLGNCDACWKKDLKILTRIAKRRAYVFDWWQHMTDKYGDFVPEGRISAKEMKPPFNFYRGNLSPKDIFKISKLKDTQIQLFEETHDLKGCGESCEAF